MLHNLNHIVGYSIDASDGAIGSLKDLYFDDSSTLIRYLVVDTGNWLPGRRVLLVPAVIGGVDAAERKIVGGLTRGQVKDSPGIDAHRPVSRQHEISLHEYYDWRPYWEVPPLAGTVAPYWGGPMPVPAAPAPTEETVVREVSAAERERADPHLRSAREVAGYRVAASNGEIGHVDDFLIDDGSWAIEFLVVDTRNWLPGRKVLIAPRWLRELDWAGRVVYVDLTRERIKSSPEYDAAMTPDEGYLERLFGHYGTPVR
jgi:PRC-barrel domain